MGGECIEGASIVKKDNKLYMFYAGAYNNAPQQIGVAVSEDGLNWKRLSEEPFYEMENRENGIQVNLVILTFYRS